MKDETRLTHIRSGAKNRRTVNPPIERASTIILPTQDALYGQLPTYGRMGLGVHRELEAAMSALENAHHTKLTSNGLQACTLAIGSVLEAGDHLLFTDTIYGPTKRFCERRLKAMGISASAVSPRLDAGQLEQLLTQHPKTKALFLESPGSLTFEIMDTQALVAAAQARGLTTIADNTWGVGLLHRPLDLGVDISVQALTKYVVGHADALGGAVMTKSDALFQRIVQCADDWGLSLSPDDAYTALRGVRTLPTRLKQHEASGYKLANWLNGRPEVAEVLHPGLPHAEDHTLWQRDFSGANGLFGAVFQPASDAALNAFLETLSLFAMGFSWGGYESLVIPCDPQLRRLPGDPIHQRAGPLIRFHIGLEAAEDLIADLERGFAAMAAA